MRTTEEWKLFRVSLFLTLLSLAGIASANQVLLTDSLSAWETAAPGFINVAGGYGSGATALGTGSVSYPSGTVLSIGNGWATWCCGYGGQVIWTGTSTTLTFTGLAAFGVEVEPDMFQTEGITVTLSDGQTITDNVGGYAGAQFFGFSGAGITSMTITDNASDDFAFGNFYALPAASQVTITGADLVSNTVTVQLSGPADSTGVLTVNADGASGEYPAQTQTTPVGPGTYTLKFDRPNMSIDTYASVTATWAVSPKSVTTTYALKDDWTVVGLVRHSQYNTPYEYQCAGAPAPAWIFNSSTCQFTKVTLNGKFMRQVYINGTGMSQEYGLLKYNNPNNGLCGSQYPRGATAHNTFREISAVSGACGTVLTGGQSVATYPSPNTHSTYSCGDTVLLSTSANTNEAVKEADDYCPACSKDFRGAQGHIDDYSSVQACTGAGVGDLGNFWTANTHGERQ